MMIKFIASVAINIILTVGLTLFCQTSAIAQYKSEELIEKSINIIADYTSIQSALVDELLQANGYIITIPVTDWEQLSDYDKLYIAAGQAEEAKTGSGRQLIQVIHQQLINRIPSFAYEDFPLKRNRGTISSKTFLYSHERYTKKLPRDIEKSIAVIADYTNRLSSPISVKFLLREFAGCHTVCFLKEIIKTHSVRDAFISKFSKLQNPPRDKRVAQASLRVQMAIPAARHEPCLAATIYRFLFSSDWITIRNTWEDAVVDGKISTDKDVKASHYKSVELWNDARMLAIKSLLDNGVDITNNVLEQSFIDAAIHNTAIATSWGFAVTSFYKNKLALEQLILNDADHYTDVLIEKVAYDEFPRYRTESRTNQIQLNNDIRTFLNEEIDIKIILYDRGLVPANGWVLYSTNMGRESRTMIDFTHTINFENSVGSICPACGVARLDPDTIWRIRDRISQQNIERHMRIIKKRIEERMGTWPPVVSEPPRVPKPYVVPKRAIGR